ncbi:MAG: DUF5047 domain-containing protein [Actinomycetota bacterium]
MVDVSVSHKVDTYADVLVGGEIVEQGVPISDGSVTSDAQAQVRGQAKISVPDPSYAPLLVSDRLSVGGAELQVYRTVNDTAFPLGVFRIDLSEVDDTGDALTTGVTAYDRSQAVNRARLETTKVIAAGTNYVDAIVELVQEAVPWVEVVSSATTRTTPQIVLDGQSERWTECVRIAEAIGFVCYFDQLGRLNVHPEPTTAGAAVRTIGDGPGGVLVKAGLRWSVEGVHNAVIATGDGDAGPFYGAAYDLDPTSVTYYLGTFGQAPRFYSSEFFTSDAQAVEAAQGILERYLGVPRSVTFDMVPDPALAAGNVVRIERETLGIVENHLIDRITIPLTPEGVASAATRTQVLT